MNSVTSEMTDRSAQLSAPCLLYDGQCSFCISLAQYFEPWLRRRGIALAPLQAPWVAKAFRISEGAPIAEMRLLLPDGSAPGGADAILLLARQTFWGWPLVLLSWVPGTKTVLRASYRYVAGRRHCFGGTCSVEASGTPTFGVARTVLGLVPPLILVCLAVWAARFLAPWVFMWVLAGSVFFGFKWLTVRRVLKSRQSRSRFRWAAYFFAWPGMNPRPFLLSGETRLSQATQNLFSGAFNTLAGALILILSAYASTLTPIVCGWLGMLGIVLFLHFGIFDLLAFAWRKHRIPVRPVMCQPWRATSLANFWGRRWNTAFSDFARDVFLPILEPRAGPRVAVFLIFLISGMIHDLIISVPAGSGYGLPTLYFLLQGTAVLFEKSSLGRELGLGAGWRGRLYAITIAMVPAFFLFHLSFIRTVILPMLDEIGHAVSVCTDPRLLAQIARELMTQF